MPDHHLSFPERIVHVPDAAFFHDLENTMGPPYPWESPAAEGHFEEAMGRLRTHFEKRPQPVHPFFDEAPAILPRIPRNAALADLILKGESYQLDTEVYDFAGPIDFNAPRSVSTKHGFHYLAWMDCLLHAAVEKQDPAYLEAWSGLFNQWYEQRESITRARARNDVVFYELGLASRSVRFINFLFCARFLGVVGQIDCPTFGRLLKSLLGAARWLVLEDREKGYRLGNWPIFSARFLLQFGILFPEFRESTVFRETAAKILEDHIERDFYADGGHSERCFSYGSTILTDFAESLHFMDRNPDLRVPRRFDWRNHLSPIYEWFLKTVAPGPEFPGFGDGEFIRRDNIFHLAYRLFDDPKYLWPLRHKEPALESLARDPGYRSVLLPESGFCVLRDGFDPGDACMLLNFGDFQGYHSHMDLLDFTLYAHGAPLAAEVGRFNAYDQPFDLFFRSPRAHNQMTVEGASMERDSVRGKAIRFNSTPGVDFFSGFHEAYLKSAGILLERRVFFIKSIGFCVCDTAAKVEFAAGFYKSARNSFQWHLHSPFPFTIGDHDARAVAEEQGLLVIPENQRSLRFGHTSIDYLAENTIEFPHWKAREEPVLWPDRYALNLRTWQERHPVTPMDVALLPFSGMPQAADLTSLEASFSGACPRHVRPRALRLKAGEHSAILLVGDAGGTLSLMEGSFSGHAAVLLYKGSRLSGVFAHEATHLSWKGEVFPSEVLASGWISS
ncbi:MAG: heparinase II/III family protein [Oceanipulchritudo sp.]